MHRHGDQLSGHTLHGSVLPEQVSMVQNSQGMGAVSEKEGRLNSLEEARKIMIRRKDGLGIKSSSGLPGGFISPLKLGYG